jgi:hypothetical protein
MPSPVSRTVESILHDRVSQNVASNVSEAMR